MYALSQTEIVVQRKPRTQPIWHAAALLSWSLAAQAQFFPVTDLGTLGGTNSMACRGNRSDRKLRFGDGTAAPRVWLPSQGR
jgi:hypothetical protein